MNPPHYWARHSNQLQSTPSQGQLSNIYIILRQNVLLLPQVSDGPAKYNVTGPTSKPSMKFDKYSARRQLTTHTDGPAPNAYNTAKDVMRLASPVVYHKPTPMKNRKPTDPGPG